MSSPTQINRPFRVKTSLGDDALLLDSFSGVERVSEPFRFVLRLLSPDPNVDMQSLLTQPVVLSLQLDDDSERHIHGNISRMKLLHYGSDGMAAYEAEVVPWFWFLSLFSDCRIFQNQSVPDIVEKVFKDRGFSDFKSSLKGTYNPREYCVQYRESDFNFVSRLLEEEGIFYFFEQSEEKHTLVLGDDATAFAACPDQATARFMPSEGGRMDDDTVATLEAEFRIRTGTASLTDYDFTQPNTSLFSTLAGQQQGEAYDYPGKYSTKDDGDHYARIRLEELEVGISTVRGESNCMGFQSGYKFTLSDHYRDSANTDYTLLMLEHHARNSSYRAGQVDPFDYRNRFEAIPNSVPFRPPRRARKPVIEGTQTAMVVGKSGEEIWTDQYGRVVVQFFWDRIGTSDENSSCWIRVAQGWAGKQWGFIAIPRIGQEVIVSFLEGDPDRPIITGSVYNAVQMPPYTLPDNQTQSTWKSMSSKGGGGFNELRFEDNKGSEQIFIHGEKDMDMRIKNDRREWIGEDRHLVVTRDKLEKTGRDSHLDLTRDHIEKIGRDHHLAIGGKEAISITGSHSLAVTGDVIEQFSGNHSSQVTQNLYLKAMQVVIEASVGLTIKAGSNFITIDPSGVAISGTPMVQINSAGSALSGSAGSLVSPISPTDATNASDADPGAVTSVTAGTAATPAGMSLQDIPPATPGKKSAASDAPTHDPNSPDNKTKEHWIEIKLVDDDGNPVPGEPYKITLPDGTTVADGTLDDKGLARVDNIDPGNCQVTFPNLDKKDWSPA
ncbi:MAG TPA: type VI secretion system tip protein TssI/VgrG [Bryobacteraceae bacterium]|nr:type VI secretion system tip protein TssI/VgrG [Bryobacteraceae bacterium]